MRYSGIEYSVVKWTGIVCKGKQQSVPHRFGKEWRFFITEWNAMESGGMMLNGEESRRMDWNGI